MPTVKYVGKGTAILFERRSETASLSSANKFPETMANAKLFLACKVESLVNTGWSWPLTSPRTILF